MKRTVVVLLLASISLCCHAQIPDVHKPALESVVPDSLVQFRHEGRYSEFDSKVGNLYEFSPFDPLSIKAADPIRVPLFHLTLGSDFPLTPHVSLGCNKIFNENFTLGISGSHDSFFAGVPGAGVSLPVGERFTDNSIKGVMKYGWNEGIFALNVEYGYNTRFFNSSDESFTAFHNRSTIGIKAGISSTKNNESNLHYDFSLAFLSTEAGSSDASGPERKVLSENTFDISGFVGTTFDVHRVYVDMSMIMTYYSLIKDYSSIVVQFSPFYEYKNKRFSGKFGVKFGNRFGNSPQFRKTRMDDGNDLEAVSSIFPNVDARFEIARKWLWAHLTAVGGYNMNSYSSLAGDCVILSPDTPLRLGSTPVDLTLALESVVSSRLAFNLSGRYALKRNCPVISPVVDGSERAASGIYEIKAWDVDVNSFVLAAEALWKSSSFSAGGEFRYSRWWKIDGTPAVEFPRFGAKGYARYNWRERIVISASLNWFSSYSGDMWGHYEVPSACDLNIGLTYNVNRHFSIFAKCGNVLDAGIQYIPLYYGAPRNFGGGVTFLF